MAESKGINQISAFDSPFREVKGDKATIWFAPKSNGLYIFDVQITYMNLSKPFLSIFLFLISLSAAAQPPASVDTAVIQIMQEWHDALGEVMAGPNVSDSLYQILVTERGKPNEPTEAYFFHRMGLIQEAYDEYERAISSYHQAIRLRRELPGPIMLYDVLNGYRNISACLTEQKKYGAAIDSSRKALQLLPAVSPHDTLYKIQARLLLAEAEGHRNLGDTDNALNAYRALIALEAEIKRKDFSEGLRGALYPIIARGLSGLGLLLTKRASDTLEAYMVLAQAASITKEKLDRDEYLLATILQTQAKLAEIRGRYDEAIALAKESVDYFRVLDNEETRPGFIDNYNNLSVFYKRKGDLKAADKWLRKAIDLRQSGKEDYLDDYIYDNLGDLAFLRGDPDDPGSYRPAIDYYRKAINYLLPADGLENADLSDRNLAISDKDGLLTTLSSLAKTYVTMGDQVEALAVHQKIGQVIERMRLDFRPDASKGLLAERAKPLYAAAIETCWQLYQRALEPKYAQLALLFSERSRSLILNDAVGHVRASSMVGDSALVARERRLHLELNYTERQLALLNQAPDSLKERDAIETNRKELLDLRRRHDAVVREMEARYPAYAAAKNADAERDFYELQAGLLDEHSYLEYFISDDGSYAFLLNGQVDIYFFKLEEFPSDATGGTGLNPRTTAIKTILSQLEKREDGFFETGHLLYQNLLAPILATANVREELVIIPDGNLAYLSFDMLPVEVPEDTELYTETFTDYLLYQKTISYQHSLALHRRAERPAFTGLKPLLGVSPDFSDSVRIRGKTFPTLNNQDLIDELVAIYANGSRQFPGISLEELREEIENYRIVQFASHAYANDENGELSYILLDERGEVLVYAKDLYGLRMAYADLVMLNVCEGANGDLREGQGLISLSRGFFYAGARSVTAALWKAEDTATNDITRFFHKYLRAGEPKNIALQRARQDYLEMDAVKGTPRAHPFYWAAMLPVGDMAAMEGLKQGGWPWSVKLGLGLIALVFTVLVGRLLLRRFARS